MVQQLFTDDQLSKDCARALSLQLSSFDATNMQQIQGVPCMLLFTVSRFVQTVLNDAPHAAILVLNAKCVQYLERDVHRFVSTNIRTDATAD